MKTNLSPNMLDIKEHSVESGGFDLVKVPFELSPYDFLEFAKEDLKERTERNTVNALGNIKRSIHCLCDGLLYVLDYLERTKEERWNFPQKLDFLGEIGIVAPYVLERINSMRNLLEHEFLKPKREEVESAFAVANLFFFATSRFTRRFPRDFSIWDKDENIVFFIAYDRKEHRIIVNDRKGNSIELDEGKEGYADWLRKFFEIHYLLV